MRANLDRWFDWCLSDVPPMTGFTGAQASSADRLTKWAARVNRWRVVVDLVATYDPPPHIDPPVEYLFADDFNMDAGSIEYIDNDGVPGDYFDGFENVPGYAVERELICQRVTGRESRDITLSNMAIYLGGNGRVTDAPSYSWFAYFGAIGPGGVAVAQTADGYLSGGDPFPFTGDKTPTGIVFEIDGETGPVIYTSPTAHPDTAWSGDVTVTPNQYWAYERNDNTTPLYDPSSGVILVPKTNTAEWQAR